MNTVRWPPVYDAEELKVAIRELRSHSEVSKNFYACNPKATPCQGDIIQLDAPIPLIWKDGKAATQGMFEHWLVIGNTCDFDREISDVEFTQIVPIVSVDSTNISHSDRQQFLTYAYTRRFYLPPWDNSSNDVLFADFVKPVTVHKQAVLQHATIKARLKFHSWLLLNSCLVRFLARDDGRFDSS